MRDALTALNLEQPIYPSAMEDYLEAIQDDVAKDAGESRLKKDPDTVDPYYSVEDIIQAIDAIIKEVNDGYFGQFFCFDVEVAKARVLQKDMEDECGITLNIQALNGYGEPYLGFNEDWDVYMLVTIGEDKADGAKLLLENGAAEVTFFDSHPSLPGWPAYIDVPEGANNEPFTEIAEWVIAQATFYVVPPEELDGAEVMEYPYAIGPFSIEAVPTHLGITVVTDQEEGTPTFKSDELMEFKLQLFYEVYQGEAGVAGVQNQDQEFKLVTTYYDEHDVQIGIGPNIDNLFDVWFAGGEATVWVWAGQQTADEGANVHVVIDGLNLEAKDIVNVIITAADPDHLCAEWDEAGNITLEVHDHRSQVVKAVDDKKVHLWMLVGPLGDASGMTALNGGTDPFAVPDEEGDVRVTFKNGEATILFANSPFQDWLDMRMTQEGIDEVTLVIISLDPDLAITPAELKYPAN